MKTSSHLRRATRHAALRPQPLALALASASMLSLLPGLEGARAQALPTGAAVVHGQANIATSGNQMTVTNSNGAILNWQSFSIGAGHSVRFEQANAASQVLNRVVGNDPSNILGSLSSNGRVWLLNPNGVLFGQGARVDVAALVASTLNIANNDWLAGRYTFSESILGQGQVDGAVVNQGEIRTTLGGRVALIGSSGGVKNEGVIDASGGQVMLAAGQSVDLVDTGAPNLTLRVTAPKGEALNLGTLAAAGGRIDVQAALVNQQGIVRAGSIQRGAGGEIVIGATEGLNLAAGSRTDAGGTDGGKVTLDAGAGTLMAGGTVDASGTGGRGGQVKLLGRQVGVLDGATVDASGRNGGGEVFVGGGLQGQDKAIPNADAVYIGAGATIAADATAQGDGGRIIVWSNQATRAHGAFNARGGAQGGNGGFVETSGGWLDTAAAKVDTTAKIGDGGTWLLDPNNILISENASVNSTTGPNFTTTNDSARIFDGQIRGALLSGQNVTVTTGTAGTNAEAGDIILLNANLSVSTSFAGSLTLNAHRNILVVGSTIGSSLAPVDITFNSTQGAGGIGIGNSIISTPGTIRFNARDIAIGTNSVISSDATGDAIVIKGTGQTNAATFTNQSGAGALVTRNGRFLVYATDASSASAWSPDNLTYTFRQHGVDLSSANPPAPAESGSGVLFSSVPTVTFTTQPTKVYDGNTAITLTSQTNTGAISGDIAFFASEGGADGNFNTKDVGTGKPITLLPGEARVIDSQSREVYGYNFAASGSVTPRALSVSGVTAQNKVYDGTTLATVTTGPLVGLVSGENFANVATGTFNNRDVGNAKPVTINYVLGGGTGGALASNYTVSGPTATTANITPRILSLSGVTVGDKVYDGTTIATFTGGTLSGLVAGENFTSFGTANFTPDANVGVNKTVSVSYALTGGTGGAVATNYTLSTSTPVFTASITPRPLTLSGAVASNKVYDGGTLANVNGGTLSGLVSGQNFAFTSTGTFDTKDVGNGKTVTVNTTLGAGSGGALASNYIAPASSTTTANITPRALSISGATAQDKVYDGNTNATISGGTLAGLVAGETFSTTFTGNFSDKDAGTNKSVSVSVTLGAGSNGALASNYSTVGAGSTTASITPRPLSFGSVVAADKVYDGNTIASFTSGGLIGLVGSENFGTSVSGNFDTKDAGVNKTVTYTQTLGTGSNGALASNYVLPAGGGSGTTTASITPRALTLVGVTAADKVYDGTRTATVTGGTLAGLVGNESFQTTGLTGNFDTKDAGQNKGVIVDVQLVNGSNGALASNYTIANTAATTASITPRALSVSGVTANSKVYDGTTVATLSGGTLNGLVAGESFGTTAVGNFDTKDAGVGKTVNYTIALGNGSGGALASNYTVSGGGTTTGTISPKKIDFGNVVIADKVYDGTTTATLTSGGLVGLVGNETFATTATASFADRNAGNGKSVAVQVTVGEGSNGALASNYIRPTGANATGNITPRGLSVSGFTTANKVYDTTRNASVGNWTLTGVIAGDNVNVTSGSASFSDANVGTNKTVTGQATALGGTSAGNYTLAQGSATSTASITPATLTYTANPASSISGAPLPAFGGTVTGFVGGETQGSATTGSVSFTSPAASNSPPGQYAINGSGLSAQNYVFTQAAGNATALTMGVAPVASNQDTNAATQSALESVKAITQPEPVVIPTPPDQPPSGRTLDAFPALTVATAGEARSGAGAQALTFRSLPVESMSQGELSTLLSARDRYKKSVFSEALSRLEQNPELADVGACQTAEQVESGTCLITESLKREIQEARRVEEARVAAGGAPRPAPAPAPVPAPAPAPAVAAAPAPTIAAPAPAPLNEIVAGTLERRRGTSQRAALPQIERKIAVLIGTDQYADARIPKLDNAVGDVRAVGSLLDANLGYQTVRIENGSKATIIRTLNRLALEVGPKDSVVVYYAGHGELVASTGLGYWQPANADSTKPESWLSNADIGRLLAQVGASQVALISDSCYSGSLVSNERIRTSGNLDPQQVLARKSVVVMSSGGNEPVFDQGKDGHSPFAWNLMRNLQQVSTWQPGGNVFERVRFAVAKELPQRPQYGAFQQAGHQAGGDYLFEQRQ